MQWFQFSSGTIMMLGEVPPAGRMLSMFRGIVPTVQASAPSAMAVAKATPKVSAAMCPAPLRCTAAPDFESTNRFDVLREDAEEWLALGSELGAVQRPDRCIEKGADRASATAASPTSGQRCRRR